MLQPVNQGKRGAPNYHSRAVIDLRNPWWIGGVEIPTRLVLAPMAGVSVQAFRRQGRRYGAGLVCSEMVSCAGLSHGNERTLGYLLIGSDEHPLAVQIFGSEPAVMAEAARMVGEAGADLIDINFGCPVRKVTKTGAGATLLEDPDRACRIVSAVSEAVAVPVTVKMRRGIDDDSRARSRSHLDWSRPVLPRSHSTLAPLARCTRGRLTTASPAELVERCRRPRDRLRRRHDSAKAVEVLGTTGCAAVMVGRAAQGNPWAIAAIMGDDDAATPTRDEAAAELLLFIEETARELGEKRASGFLKKFYAGTWGGTIPEAVQAGLVQLDSLREVERRLLSAAPGAAHIVESLRGERRGEVPSSFPSRPTAGIGKARGASPAATRTKGAGREGGIAACESPGELRPSRRPDQHTTM